MSPLGLNTDDTWAALLAGRSGAGRIQAFDPEEYQLKTHIACELDGFDPSDYMDRREARRIDRFSQMAFVAAAEAVERSGLKIDDANRHEVGTLVASAIGGIISLAAQVRVLGERGARRVDPFTIPKLMPNAASGFVSLKLGASGPCLTTVSACASGADALGSALEMIRSGRATAMIAGGSEAAIEPVAVAGFEQAHALCTDSNDQPQKALRPFDSTRSGFVMGEGAAVLILEEEEHAISRGAPILAEFAGWGAAADAYHMTAPDPDGRGGTRAMSGALEHADLGYDEVVYINAHGTSTPLNDAVETRIIKSVFGERAGRIPVSSTKSMIGHLGGAAGALEAAVCVKTIETGIAPPTINYEHPDPECDLDYIANKAREVGQGVALSNSFGFGGHSSCLAFAPYLRR